MASAVSPSPWRQQLSSSCTSADVRYKRKYIPNFEVDQAIREAYERQRQGDRKALLAVSARLGWPKNAVCKRAAELGLPRVKEPSWTNEEEQVLERWAHLAPSGIRMRLALAGFCRSIAAIQIKLNRERMKQNLDGYSANGLADALGVDTHKVLSWIRRGLLRAQRRGTERTASQGGDTWWIARREVKRFVLRAPDEIDLARVEKIWFLDLLTDGKIGSARVE